MSGSPFKSSLAAAVWGLGTVAVLGMILSIIALSVAGGQKPRSMAITKTASSLILGAPADSRNLSIGLRVTDAGKGLVLQDADIDAADWPIVSFSLDAPGSLEAVFVWEANDGKASLHDKILKGDAGAVLMKGEPGWQGRINRVGLLLRPAPGTADPGSSIVRADVALSKMDPGPVANVLVTRWSHFRGWTGLSINHLGQSWLPLLLVLWSALGAMLAGVLCREDRLRATGMTLVGGLGAGWLLLQVLWLQQLGTQAAETRDRYAGRDFESALARGQDVELVGFAAQVRKALAGERPNRRIALISDRRFFGERSRYLLLPHPVTHYRSTGHFRSRASRLREGDAVIVEPGLADEVRRILSAAGIDFREALSNDTGVLYRVDPIHGGHGNPRN